MPDGICSKERLLSSKTPSTFLPKANLGIHHALLNRDGCEAFLSCDTGDCKFRFYCRYSPRSWFPDRGALVFSTWIGIPSGVGGKMSPHEGR